MVPSDSTPSEAYWQEDSFSFIKPEELNALGIDPKDIPQGTFAAHKHPAYLPSRFGGNAYGLGFYEAYERLNPDDIKILQRIPSISSDKISQNYREFNNIFRNIGLLIRFSRLGKPYYLIPIHLVSQSLSTIKNKADEISKIIHFHRGKYLKETQKIGLFTHADDLIVNDLSLRFKEHQFIIIDSLKRLGSIRDTIDLVILNRDIYETLFMEKFIGQQMDMLSKKELTWCAHYMLGKIYDVLKPGGEIFIIANRHALKTSETVNISFKSDEDEKNFFIFSHIFKTKKKYQAKNRLHEVNVFDFQKYLSGLYVEQDVLEKLLEGRSLEKIALEEVDRLTYLKYPLDDDFNYNQEKEWSRLLSVYFSPIFLKPLIPQSVKKDREKRFVLGDYNPGYMLIYLGQKKSPGITYADLEKDVMASKLAGCPLSLIADYRNSFDFLIRTLRVLEKVKQGQLTDIPNFFVERLRVPFENKKRRYSSLNDVIKLISKINRLERIRSYVNPKMIGGARAEILKNLERLSLFGFNYGELKEIFLIVLGHTPMGRILSGKMNEKTLTPVSDLARTYVPQQALNLLRYCSLMSMAETVASKKSELNQEQLAELFDLYESMIRVVTNRELNWDALLDEKISSMGGIHNQVVRKILKMMNHFQFLNNWSELSSKGDMEKESLSDYEESKLAQIENIINLVKIIEKFEILYFGADPLQWSTFYRKFLHIEFHGTGQLFERMDSRWVFILLWVTVNLVQGDIINFNPILADTKPVDIDDYIRKVENAAKGINTDYLDPTNFAQFKEQLYKNQTAFLLGTGFQLKVNNQNKALDVGYIDMEENIRGLEILVRRLGRRNISEIPVEDLAALERLFASLEGFYQSHLRLISGDDTDLKLPEMQKKWFHKARDIRKSIESHFITLIFKPESIYTDISRLYTTAPSILNFVLPEFMALKDLMLPGKVYLKSPLIHHIIKSTKKIEALVRRDRAAFQDMDLLHKLAQREFGPMDVGIVGLNESQIKVLEDIVTRLLQNESVHQALIKSFIFRDRGHIPTLREKYHTQFNAADHAQAGAYFLEKEAILSRYSSDRHEHDHLSFLVKYHDFLHHMIRGEFSIYAIKKILDLKDKALFDAFFICSLIIFISMREDLVLEDLATRIFRIKMLCDRIIMGEASLEDHLKEVYSRRGHVYYALEAYKKHGLPDEVRRAGYLESVKWDEDKEEEYARAGRLIYAMERIFRLRGIRYIEFRELANLMVHVPLKFIYRKRHFFGIGYATFERELFEALRIYNGLSALPDETRHFILEHLVGDDVRIFGFGNVAGYLNYENQIKLLLIALLGVRKLKNNVGPVCLDFQSLSEKIDKRYEAVNDTLSAITIEKIWNSPNQANPFFRAKKGVVLKRDDSHHVLAIDYVDKINITQKVSYMRNITEVDQLKNYFYYSLRSLRKNPFHTEDYERALERVYESRLNDIIDLIIQQSKRQMALLQDFREIHKVVSDLNERALDLGFTEEQKHRLHDLYELRKDQLKREKLGEISEVVESINEERELRDYWNSIKWYLSNNRAYLGKEFEGLVAKKFDEKILNIKGLE